MDEKQQAAYRSAEQGLFGAYSIEVTEDTVAVPGAGIRLRVLSAGADDGGPPLVCLHGSPSSAAGWIHLAAAMPQARMFMLDTPGAGLSAPFEQWNHHREQSLSVLDAVLEHFGLDSVHLVGSSLGGLYAYNFALARPERTLSMIQMGCPSGPELLPIPIFERILALPIPAGVLTGLIPSTVKGARKMFADIGHGPAIESGAIPEATFAWYAALLGSTDTVRNTLPEIRAIESFFGRRESARISNDDLANLSVPTLYLWGDADPMAKPSHGDALTALTPGARIEHLEGFGHLPWFDDVAVVAQHVREFLAESTSGHVR